MRPSMLDEWRGFLTGTEDAFDQQVREGRSRCLERLDLVRLEPTGMAKAWLGVRADVISLVEGIRRAFRERVAPGLAAQGLSGRSLDEEEARGRRTGSRLLRRLERAEIQVFAEASEALLKAARTELGRRLVCPRCQARLLPPPPVFRPGRLLCPRCRAASPFVPPPPVARLEPFCAHHLSQRAALVEWEALIAAEGRREEAGRSRELEADVADARRRYWAAYSRAREGLTLAPSPAAGRNRAS